MPNGAWKVLGGSGFYKEDTPTVLQPLGGRCLQRRRRGLFVAFPVGFQSGPEYFAPKAGRKNNLSNHTLGRMV